MQKYIKKQSGKEELFNPDKLKKSLINAGTDAALAEDIVNKAKKDLDSYLQTKDIYRDAIKQLKKSQPPAAIRYTLKNAIMGLGPTGYVFEKYIAKILEEYGYNTEIGRIVEGFCVEHEVDVLAEKSNGHYMVECKYRNDKDMQSDIKVALYVHSRFRDIKKACESGRSCYNFKEGWLITNTKVTSQAVKYADCSNFKIIAWHHPQDYNLEYFIENKKIYPVSILSGLSKSQKSILFDNEIITIKDMVKIAPAELSKIINTGVENIYNFLNQANMLLSQ